MIKRASVLVVAGFWLLHSAWTQAATEIEERDAITKETRARFSSADYDALEKAAAKYRQEKSRTPSGLWKLTIFYAGIDEEIESCGKARDPNVAYDVPEETAKQWAERYPSSPTGHIVRSMVLIDRAWAYRGCGSADTVSDAAWVKFRQYIEAARANLEEHKAVASKDPKWYGAMLIVAKAQQWDDSKFNRLIDEALGTEPLYYQNYFSALENLLPKWGGDVERIEDFAQEAVKRTRAEEGQGMYARIYWYASQTQYKSDIFTNTLADWPQFKVGFDDVIARYPDAWNLNNYARFACMARDKQKTIELLKRIGPAVVASAWVPLALKTECANWAARP